MKNLTTLLAIAPFTFFAQNTVLTNIAPNAGNMQTVNYNYNGNSYNNNVKQTNIPAGLSNISLLNNYRSAQVINNTIAHPTNGTNAVVRSAPVRRNINRSPVAQRSRPHNSTNTVAYHRAAPTHRQQTQVAN
ncbi:MAG: hypothetical protein IAF38_04010, partial [Bacteroidia bacterium]|nr:hypothetical protein [Bacteroidia bacterium]